MKYTNYGENPPGSREQGSQQQNRPDSREQGSQQQNRPDSREQGSQRQNRPDSREQGSQRQNRPDSGEQGSRRQKAAEVKNLVKTYGVGGVQTKVLKGIDLSIEQQDFIAVMGPSGSGKTTLLNILSTIDRPTAGTVILAGQDIARLSNRELSKLRRDKIGFVFQDYNLLDTMVLQDNIALPLALNGVSGKKAAEKTAELAAMMGLSEHLQKYPYQLSGGQKQRGATCRALITEPEIIFADEPTGALDSKSSRDLLECFVMLNERRKTAILMVTHDPFCASYAKDVCILTDGRIMCRLSRGSDRKEFYDRIIDVQTSMGGDFPCQW